MSTAAFRGRAVEPAPWSQDFEISLARASTRGTLFVCPVCGRSAEIPWPATMTEQVHRAVVDSAVNLHNDHECPGPQS